MLFQKSFIQKPNIPRLIGIQLGIFQKGKIFSYIEIVIILNYQSDSGNPFEAFSAGASAVIGSVAAIIANLIAFTAGFEFLNSIVSWFFSLVNLNNFGLSVRNYF